MSYAVFWVPSAEQDLAAAWLGSADRNAVTRAAFRLEQHLLIDPLHSGVASRQLSVQRVAYEAPVGIEFEVVEDDKKVRVLTVWLME